MCEKHFLFRYGKKIFKKFSAILKKNVDYRLFIYYMAAINGSLPDMLPILVAFFRTAPGMSAALYSLFSIAEFLGRTIGGVVQYRIEIPKEKILRYFCSLYLYECMDLILLWLPYPLMLVNRAFAGFFEQTAPPYVLPPSSLTFRNPCAPESMHLKI